MVFSTYSVASGSSMLLWGRMADVRGRWGVFLVGASTFALFTFLVPFSPSEPWLYVLQVFQGFSSAATVPSGIGILATTFPPGKERNLAFVAVSASTTLGAVLGNIAGGAIGGLLSWKWGFWIPAAMAAPVALSAYALYPSQRSTCSSQPRRSDTENQQSFDNNSHHNPESVDYTGGILIFTSLALFQVGLSQGNVDGWANPHVPGLICASIVVGYIFVMMQVRMESSHKHPLVRLSMFRNSGFSAVFALTACFFGSFNGFLVFASML
jgi:MFS family permease